MGQHGEIGKKSEVLQHCHKYDNAFIIATMYLSLIPLSKCNKPIDIFIDNFRFH